MKKIIITVVSSILLVPMLITQEAQAVIYKCTNAKQEVYYNDKPCPAKDDQSEFEAVKDPVNGYIPPAFTKAEVNKANSSTVKRQAKADNEIDSSNREISNSVGQNNDKQNSNGNSESSSAAENSSSSSTEKLSQASTNAEGANTPSNVSESKLNVILVEPFNL